MLLVGSDDPSKVDRRNGASKETILLVYLTVL